eukprot:scaffold12.g8108.t1
MESRGGVAVGVDAILGHHTAPVNKTKVVCTLGPASRDIPTLCDMLRSGMNETLNNLRTACRQTGIMCAVMLDTKGPEIRTGFLENEKPVQLVQGQEITITTDYSIKGNKNLIAMSYKKLAQARRTARRVDRPRRRHRARAPAQLRSPGVNWGVPNEIDLIAASFVRKGSDLDCIRKVLGPKGQYIKIISKVENGEGVSNYDEILEKSDAIMVARGDLGMEIPTEKVMTKICREAEASIDYYSLFKAIMKRTPLPMTPLESLASSAVRTAHKVQASLIVVLTRGGATARLVAKYRPTVPILTVVVPVLTTDNLTWQCSSEAPARQCLTSRGLVPILAEGSARASDSDTTDEILNAALDYAKEMRYCRAGDCVVALHRIGNASVIKLVDIK